MPKRLRDAVAASEKEQRTAAESRRRAQQLQDTVADPRMTLTERRYATRLDDDPKVLKWWFEPRVFALGRNCDYTPDFSVTFNDGRGIEYHEVKGKWVPEDGRIKWKWAGEKYQEFRFAWCSWTGGVWKVSYYKPLPASTER